MHLLRFVNLILALFVFSVNALHCPHCRDKQLVSSSRTSSSSQGYASQPSGFSNLSTQEQQALALIQSLKTGSRDAANAFDSHNFVQHNLDLGEGVPGYLALQSTLSGDPSTVVNPVRVFQDGDFVFLHVDYTPKVGLDVYRFQDGKIVEHWDNVQDIPPTPNGAGHTMVDGPVQAKDLDKTEANKAFIRVFVTDVFLNGNGENAGYYVSSVRYIQHNPQASADGLAAAEAVIGSLPPGSTPCYRLRRVLGQGDFVLTMCDGKLGASLTAFYDLYRLENGRIVEHWDVIQPIPPCSQWANLNAKF